MAIPKPTATNLVTSKEVAPDRDSPSEHEAQFVVGKTIPSAGGLQPPGILGAASSGADAPPGQVAEDGNRQWSTTVS